jgi:hypothetical protein
MSGTSRGNELQAAGDIKHSSASQAFQRIESAMPATMTDGGAPLGALPNRLCRQPAYPLDYRSHAIRLGTRRATGEVERRSEMLWTIAVILAVLWLLGLVSSYTMGGFIHILLVLAIVIVLINVIQGRRAL